MAEGDNFSYSVPTQKFSPNEYVTMRVTHSPIHLTFTISNIVNFIKITLRIEKGIYNTWSKVFKIHARIHPVIDHFIPTETVMYPDIKVNDCHLWACLDVVVHQIQWIYDIIFDDLLHTIIECDLTAELACNRLFNIFYHEKNYMALYLEQEFHNVTWRNFLINMHRPF